MKKPIFWFMVGFFSTLAVLYFFGCNDTTLGPDGVATVEAQQREVVVNGTEATGEGPTDCELLRVVQRRPKSRDSNIVVLEISPTQQFDKLWVKFITSEGGYPVILHIEKAPPVDQVFEVEITLPRCGVEYQVYVFVEGNIGDKIHQCDGSLSLTMKCELEPPCTDCVKTCDPPPPKPCPEATWLDYPTCDWTECKEECEPTDEPLCKRYCTWNTETCEWDCDYPDCGEYYFFSWEECKCEGKAVCHVSNKGGDGDWNLQESQKRMTPGHEKHLNPDEFCPPDYLGACYNKYAQNPHPCMEVR